jgi:hypothetical protein
VVSQVLKVQLTNDAPFDTLFNDLFEICRYFGADQR